MSTRREFRYVIVGAGSAGCLLARLLAAQQHAPVAVIEAGGCPAVSDVRSVVPSFYPRTFHTRLDWDYVTVPQSGLGGRRVAWPRGKLLGGSGAINALIYMQAAAADFAHWGWAPTPQFPSSWFASEPASSATIHSLTIAPLATPHPWTEAFLQSAENVGLQRVERWSQAVENSCGYFQLTQHQGRRCHTGQWLSQADSGEAPQVTLFTDSHVRRLVLRQQRATAVELFNAAGMLETIHASDEIILCGGAIGSPTLLLASGIGHPDDLLQEQIACTHPLPWVGRNLQDHLVYPLIYSTGTAMGLPRRHRPAERQVYRDHGTGPLASNIAEAGALFHTTSDSRAEEFQADRHRPEFQLHFTPTHYLKYPRLASGDHFLSLGVTDLHPASRGHLQLVRRSAQWQTCIDPRYLDEAVDHQRMLQAIAWARELSHQCGLRDLISQEALPGTKRTTAKDVLKSLQTFAQSIYHPVGTCRMDCGTEVGCDQAVVDSSFRVHGLQGLRVVDASVLPSLPSCNTNAVTLALAVRAAEKMLGRL